MSPHPVYLTILEVAFGWHGLAAPQPIRKSLPPVVRITTAMLLRAVVDSRLAVYQAGPYQPSEGDRTRTARGHLDEVEGTPSILAEMSASGAYDPQVLMHYRLCVDELYVWSIGEGLEPPPSCMPSWTHVERTAPEQGRKPRATKRQRSAKASRAVTRRRQHTPQQTIR
jgi:hypothetical protein